MLIKIDMEMRVILLHDLIRDDEIDEMIEHEIVIGQIKMMMVME
jgi:hypothetical protein